MVQKLTSEFFWVYTHVFKPPKFEKVFCGMSSVCLPVGLERGSQVPERLDDFVYIRHSKVYTSYLGAGEF
jgi:hypothetical protein